MRGRRYNPNLSFAEGLLAADEWQKEYLRRGAQDPEFFNSNPAEDPRLSYAKLVLPYARKKLGRGINQLSYDEAVRIGTEEARRLNPGMFQDNEWDFAKSITDPIGTIGHGLESAKQEHTLGGFIGRETGDKDLGLLADPAYQDVESNADPELFGDASTGKEGVFDDPTFTALLNFVPLGGFISAGGSILNKQADYGNLTAAGYKPSYNNMVVKPGLVSAVGSASGAAGNAIGGTMGGIVGGALGGAGTAALTGGNIGQGALTGAISGGIGQYGKSQGWGQGLTRGLSGAATGYLRNGSEGLKSGAINGLLTGYGGQYGGRAGASVGGLLAREINRPEVNRPMMPTGNKPVAMSQNNLPSVYNQQQLAQLYAQYKARG